VGEGGNHAAGQGLHVDLGGVAGQDLCPDALEDLPGADGETGAGNAAELGSALDLAEELVDRGQVAPPVLAVSGGA
jgi:hypothetical protein